MGNMVMDSGVLQVTNLPIDIRCIRYFASDFLVLQIPSPASVALLLSVKKEDKTLYFVLIFLVYFMCVHLFGLNTKQWNAEHKVLLFELLCCS